MPNQNDLIITSAENDLDFPIYTNEAEQQIIIIIIIIITVAVLLLLLYNKELLPSQLAFLSTCPPH